jgi:hypothetical protein
VSEKLPEYRANLPKNARIRKLIYAAGAAEPEEMKNLNPKPLT